MWVILHWVSNVSYANCCQIECTWLCARLLCISAKNRKGLYSFCQIVVYHIFLWWCKLCSRASPDKKINHWIQFSLHAPTTWWVTRAVFCFYDIRNSPHPPWCAFLFSVHISKRMIEQDTWTWILLKYNTNLSATALLLKNNRWCRNRMSQRFAKPFVST